MDKVRCPYCGAIMTLCVDAYSDGTITGAYYECIDCKSNSPYIEDAGDAEDIKDATRAAALQRYVEPLKPLELHEVTGSEEPCVFMELKGNDAIRACDCVISSDLQCVEVSLIGSSRPSQMPINFYGKKWRCWSRRPTDEERRVVVWE